jgi:hypothetical protein
MADLLNQQSQHVIVSYAYGCLDAYPATKDVAMKIFEENRQYLMPEAVQLAALDPARTRAVSVSQAADVIRDTFGRDVGAPAVRLRNFLYGCRRKGEVLDEARPNLVVARDWHAEIALWLARAQLILGKFTGADVFEHQALEQLSMFSPLQEDGRELLLVRWDDYFEMAEGYKEIVGQQWPEGAAEHEIASRIIGFVSRFLINKSKWPTLEVVKVAGY